MEWTDLLKEIKCPICGKPMQYEFVESYRKAYSSITLLDKILCGEVFRKFKLLCSCGAELNYDGTEFSPYKKTTEEQELSGE